MFFKNTSSSPLPYKTPQSTLWYRYKFAITPYHYHHHLFMLYNLKFFQTPYLPRSLYRFALRSIFKFTFTDFKNHSFISRRTYKPFNNPNFMEYIPFNFYVYNFDSLGIRVNRSLRRRRRRFNVRSNVLRCKKSLKFLIRNLYFLYRGSRDVVIYKRPLAILRPSRIPLSFKSGSLLLKPSRGVVKFTRSIFKFASFATPNNLPSHNTLNHNYNSPYSNGLASLYTSRKVRNFHLIATSILTLKHIRLRILNFFKRSYSPQASVYSLSSLFKAKNLFSLGNRISHDIPTSELNSFKYLLHFRSIFTNRKPAYFKISYMTRKFITPQRREFMLWFRKKLRYQNRISRFILKFYRFKVLEFFNKFELSLTWILFKSRLVTSLSSTQLLVKSRYVYVNGSLVTSLSTSVLYPFDVVQVKLTLKIFIFLKWQFLLNKQLFFNFQRYVRFWNSRKFRQYPKLSSYRVPHWVIHTRFFFETIPNYMEISYSALTIIILHTNLWQLAKNYKLSSLLDPVAASRNFNWKSLN
jgi:ribosomal protein S4